MMKTLIGYDGSKSANAALRDLQRAGLPHQAEALIISVANGMMIPDQTNYELAGHALMSRRLTSSLMYAQKQSVRNLREAKESANLAKSHVRSLFPFWNVRAEALSGTPWSELIKRADEWKPDLVVLGSHGRSAIGRLILGSVSTKVAADANYSVRVAREPRVEKIGKLPRIMVGVDGSIEAYCAVREIGMRQWHEGTEVRVISVDDGTSAINISQIVPGTPELHMACNEQPALSARMMVEWAQTELTAIGLNVSSHIEKGDPRTVLLEKAREWDVDSIFIGARRFSSAFERFWLGSVSATLATKAHCSVEIVRPPGN